MGLQGANSGGQDGEKVTFLAVAGGYIWDKSKGEEDADFAKQEYRKGEDEVGVRMGAQYKSVDGVVKGVRFNTHEKFGESIIVSLTDLKGNSFAISISTNNRYSQDMMKGLLLMDFNKPVKLSPYDTDNWAKKQPKRNQGIVFLQSGEKIQLRVEGAPFKGKEFWAEGNSKKIKRYFEDLTDWLIDAVTDKTEKANFESLKEQTEETKKAPVAVKVEEVVEEEMPEVSNDDLSASLDALLG
jgi:hypothetical protein